MIKVFGLKTCDTCRNALKWLDNNNIEYQFFNIRGEMFGPKVIERWACEVGWELLLNRRSTTWRNLSDKETRGIDKNSAMRLMLENPTLIKRPIFELGNKVYLGFNKNHMEAFKL